MKPKESRREFIKNTAALALLSAIPFRDALASYTANTSSPQIPTVSTLPSLPNNINDSWFETMKGHNMPKGFSRWKIMANMQGSNEFVGSFFSMDESNSKVDVFTKDHHPDCFEPEINFQKINNQYQQQGKQPVMIVAGTYTEDWEQAADKVLEYGKASGKFEEAGYRGLFVSKDGKPEITNLDDMNIFEQFTQWAQRNKWSQFQQIMVINKGKVDINSTNPTEFEWRFFVEMKSKQDKTNFGVINLHKKMTLNDAVEVLNKLDRVHNAILLDTGALSLGYFYDKNNQDYSMVDEQFSTKKDGYTNMLVMYSV